MIDKKLILHFFIISLLFLYQSQINSEEIAQNYLEGPSTRTKLIGPDGSVIDAFIPGGKILLENTSSAVLQPTPIVYAHAATEANLIPETMSSRQEDVNSTDVNLVISQEKDLKKEEALKGNGDTNVGSATEINIINAIPTTKEEQEKEEEEATVTTTENPEISGAYVPDNSEQLYDDGSYRLEHY